MVHRRYVTASPLRGSRSVSRDKITDASREAPLSPTSLRPPSANFAQRLYGKWFSEGISLLYHA
jgi:hypothetical protein